MKGHRRVFREGRHEQLMTPVREDSDRERSKHRAEILALVHACEAREKAEHPLNRAKEENLVRAAWERNE